MKGKKGGDGRHIPFRKRCVTYTHTQTDTNTRTHTRMHAHAQAQAHTHTRIRTHTHSTRTRTRTRTRTQAHTRTRPHAHAHTTAHAQTQTQTQVGRDVKTHTHADTAHMQTRTRKQTWTNFQHRHTHRHRHRHRHKTLDKHKITLTNSDAHLDVVHPIRDMLWGFPVHHTSVRGYAQLHGDQMNIQRVGCLCPLFSWAECTIAVYVGTRTSQTYQHMTCSMYFGEYIELRMWHHYVNYAVGEISQRCNCISLKLCAILLYFQTTDVYHSPSTRCDLHRQIH